MENNLQKSTLKGKMLPIFLISATCGMSNILYLCATFYVPFQAAFQFTNEQMGSLLAVAALLTIPGQFIGGILADIFNPKKLIILGLLIASACAFWLSTIPDYETTRIIYFILAIPCGFMYWAPYAKCITIMGDNSEQGRLHGTTSMCGGIMACVLFVGLAALFGDTINTEVGFGWVVRIFGIWYTLMAFGILFFYDYNKWNALYGITSKEKEKKTLKNYIEYFIGIFKEPITWIAGFMVLGGYMALTCLNYLSPYLNNVYLMPAAFAAAFGAIIRYGVKIIASPLGGTLRDTKLHGSTSKLVWIATGGMIITIVALLLVPRDPKYMVIAVIIALLINFAYRLNDSTETNVYRQLNRTPIHMLGGIIGTASVIGYSSDLWLPEQLGRILDNYGNDGYQYIFIILIGCMLMVSVFALVLYKLYKKEQVELQA